MTPTNLQWHPLRDGDYEDGATPWQGRREARRPTDLQIAFQHAQMDARLPTRITPPLTWITGHAALAAASLQGR